MHKNRRLLLSHAVCGILALAVGANSPAASAAEITATWTDGATLPFWDSVANWSTPNYPRNGTPAGTTYGVVINSTPAYGYADLDVTATIQDFTLSGGALLAAGTSNTLTVTNLFTWTGGHLGDGNGNGITINVNGGVVISGDGDKTIGGRSFESIINSNGTSSWSDGNVIGNGVLSANLFVLHNAAAGTFNVTASANTFSAQLVNDGIMNVNPGAGHTVTFSGTFTGNGTVNLSSGTLVIAPMYVGSTEGGVFNISAGSTLQFQSTLGTAGTMTGAGTVILGGSANPSISGVYNVANSVLISSIDVETVMQTATAVLQGGTFFGSGAGSFNVSGLTTVASSFYNGPVPFNANGGINFASNSSMELAGSYYINGPSSWTGTGAISFPNGVLVNLTFGPNAVFNVAGDRLLDDIYGTGLNTINNQGQIFKSAGTGGLTLHVTLTNSGLVESDSGVISATSIPVNTGTLRAANGGTITAGGAINNTGGTIEALANSTIVSGTIAGGTLHVGGTVKLQTVFSPTAYSKPASLIIDGSMNNWTGKLDIGFSGVLLEAANAGAKSTLLTTLANQINSGSNHATWTGKGITSSAISTFVPPHYGVGLFDNALLGKATFGTGSATQSADSNTVLFALAHLGDANDNGTVDIQDLTLVANNWQKSENNWAAGDLNYDGTVDIQDFTIVANNWQQTSLFTSLQPADLTLGDSVPESLSAFPSGPVPEPTSIALLSFAAPLLLRPRKTLVPKALQ